MTNEAKGMGKGLMVGIFTGAAIGSVLALLFAPKSGKKLREDIITKSQDLTEDAEKYISNLKRKASQLIHDVKKKSALLVKDAEEGVDAILVESEKIMTGVKDKVENTVHIGKVKFEKESEHLKSAAKAGIKAFNDQRDDDKL
jgi:gas vesicle protein